MISFSKLLPDKTIQLGDVGVVKKKFTATLRNPNAVIKPILLDIGDRFRVSGFNRDTESVIVDLFRDNETLMIEISFPTLLESCLIDSSQNFEPIRCVHVSHTIKTFIDTDVIVFIVVMVLAYTCGLLLGMIK